MSTSQMIIEQIEKNLPAILGFSIGASWLIQTALHTVYQINIIRIVTKWLFKRNVFLPTLTTFTLPFIFTYIYSQIPSIIEKLSLSGLVGVLGAITGTILGFLLSELRQWINKGKEASTVRTTLELEIKQDIDSLNAFLNEVNWRINSNIKNYSKLELIIADSILLVTLPQLNRRTWISQTSILPAALDEDQIKRIYCFYHLPHRTHPGFLCAKKLF